MTSAGTPHVLVVDNYDSFTYNLVQCLRALGARCDVWLSDRALVPEVVALAPHGILISPGPGAPEQAIHSLALVRELGRTLPMLGVCLGHQALALAFGASVRRAPEPVHGKTERIRHDGRSVFRGLPSPFDATRYHSLLVDRASLPRVLEISAEAADGSIMGLRHRELPLEGLQFHPESILTEHGPEVVQNWLGTL